MRTVTVVGASLAGLTAASALRAAGFDGRVVVLGEEHHAPYDRPPLSKEFLAGTASRADLDLVDVDPATGAPADGVSDVEWRLGTRAVALDPGASAVVLESGERLRSDGVVLATGARARTPPGVVPGAAPAGVHTLRTVADAVGLRADLDSAARVAVVGGGFIGAEVAATARTLGLEVTVVEAARLPLATRFGATVAGHCLGLHRDHGTRVLCGTGVAGLLGEERVRGLRLTDGREVPADVVVVGVGSAPAVEWLASCGLASPDGVRVGPDGTTGLPGVVAAGDCTLTVDPVTGRGTRNEHWTNARHQPRAAVAALLGVPHEPPASARAPYVWSDQYGRRLQFAGRVEGDEEVEIVDGDPDARDFVVVFRRAGAAVGVFGMGATRTFAWWRRSLGTPAAGPHRSTA